MARKTATIIGSDKGGVGKSLISQIMILAYDQAGRPLSAIEIDHQRKLTSVFGERVNLSLDAGVNVSQIAENPHAGERFFDRAYELWAAGDSLTDLGANVTTSLFNWIQFCDVMTVAAQDDVHFRFIATASPDDQAIRSALSAIDLARSTLGSGAEIFLLLNNTAGRAGFAPYETTQIWQQLTAMRVTHSMRVIRLPYCGSEIMDWSRAWGLSLLEVLQKDSAMLDQIAEKAKFSRVERHHQVKLFIEWLQQVQAAMLPLFSAAASSETRAAAE